LRKIKILYVIPRLAKAGTEKHLVSLASSLDRSKFDVTICCLFAGTDCHGFRSTDKHGLTRGNSVKISGNLCFKIIFLKRKNVYDLRVIFDLYRLIRKERYNIVHTYLFGFHYLAAIPAKIAGVPVVISSRRELATWKKWQHHLLENLGNIFTDKMVACSNAVREFSLDTENLTSDKIVTIYNGIDLKQFYPHQKNIRILEELGLDEKDKIVGMVANFSSVKDHKTLFKAIAEVKKTFPQVKCLLIGDGPLREELKVKSEELKVKSNIIFLGRRDDIPELLSIMDVFILTSLSEGFPNVVLEAMACGLPVVATNTGGIPEAVIDEKSGVLVKPRDYQAIADTVVRLLENCGITKDMGKRGREIAENKFKFERMLAEYENLYIGFWNKKMKNCECTDRC